MPAKAPITAPAAHLRLNGLGERIRLHRKALKVSAQAAAQAAGMSRVTLHRIEQGEASVTMGAYLNVLAALGLDLDLVTPGAPAPAAATASAAGTIRLADCPQLRRLAWHVHGVDTLTPQEAFGIYRSNWRHLDAAALEPAERRLIEQLAAQFGEGLALV